MSTLSLNNLSGFKRLKEKNLQLPVKLDNQGRASTPYQQQESNRLTLPKEEVFNLSKQTPQIDARQYFPSNNPKEQYIDGIVKAKTDYKQPQISTISNPQRETVPFKKDVAMPTAINATTVSPARAQLEQEALNMAKYGNALGQTIPQAGTQTGTQTGTQGDQQVAISDKDSAYKRAYADYISSLASSKDVEDAKNKYLNFIQEADNALVGIENKTMPMRFITGQQNQLAKLAEIKQNRLQGDIDLATTREQNAQNIAKARMDYEAKLLEQQSKEDNDLMTLSAGQTVYDPITNRSLYTAPTEGKQITLSAGQKVYDSQGNVIAENNERTDKLTTLGKDQILVDENGNVIAYGKTSEETEGNEMEKYRVERAQRVLSDVEKAKELITDGATGIWAQFSKNIGGTEAHALDQALEPIRSLIAMGELQAMRAASPTGGALGNVAASELNLLEKALGSLDVSQKPEQLLRNLENVSLHYNNWLNTINQNNQGQSIENNGDDLDKRLPEQSLRDIENELGFKNVGGDTNKATSYKVSGYGSNYWKHGLDVTVGSKGSTVSLPINGTIIDVVSEYKNPTNKPLSTSIGKSQNKGFGNQVKIRLNNGQEIWVSHLDSVNVKKGQQIKAGQILGQQGNTGLTYGNTGVHVDITAKKPDGSYYTPQEVERLFLS